MDEQTKPKKKKKKKRKNKRKDKSVGWVITMAMILIGYIGWGLMAGYYASHVEGFGSEDVMTPSGRYMVRGELQARAAGSLIIGVLAFIGNSFKQIPNLFSVLGFCFKNVPAMPITIMALEGLTFLGGFWMKKVDNELSKPAQRKPRQEIRVPKD